MKHKFAKDLRPFGYYTAIDRNVFKKTVEEKTNLKKLKKELNPPLLTTEKWIF